jgi:RNA polymerase sigma-70 factor, ECF subfamily
MSTFDEAAFLREWPTRPELAFRQLMDGFRDRIFLFCLRVAPGRSEAEDLAQEVFIRAWKGLARFRGDSSLSTWMYHIAWNVCATYIERKGHAVDLVPFTEEDSEGRETSLELSTDDPGFKQFESRQFLETLFGSLPTAQRMALTLFYLQEQSYEEIAAVTGWPLGTVKATLHRAKERIKQLAFKEMRMVG